MQLQLAAAPLFVSADGHGIALAARDAALLAWLALEGATPRARLAALLWPQSDATAARNALRQRLFHLRKSLGVELVVGSATLALASGLNHDLDDADSVLGDAPAAAEGDFATWLERQRARRRGRMRGDLAELAQMAEDAGDFGDALAHAQELLALEPLSEEAHRRLMRLHYLAGDRAAALLAFDRCEQVLKDEVGARPSASTLALLRTIDESGVASTAITLAGAVPAAVLRPPRLVGRDPELAALRQGWDAGQVLALIGEAGIGKSRVLHAFAQQCGAVVGAAARPGDAGVPFATLARLLRAVASGSASPGLDAGTQRAIARVLPEWGEAAPPLAGEGQRLALLRAVRELLAAQTGLAGIYVDDLHFADAASIDLLRSLADDGAQRWLLAYRPVEAGSPLVALHDSLVEQARLLPVSLAPLSESALAELVDSLALPGVRGAALAAGLLRRTGGNPLFVLETLKQAWVERTLDQLAASMPRPMSVLRLIERRLTQLSPGALALARCAAIAGQAFSAPLAAGVLQVHALALADAWAELERAQVMRDEHFAHDLYYDAALASVPAPIARHLHAEVATQLEQAAPRGAAPATLAQHWLAAEQPERAVPYLEQAARAAHDALDPALAASFLTQLAQARQATGAGAAAFAAAQDAMTALRGLGSGAALEAAIDRLAALARTPHERAAAHEARGVMHHMRGEPAAAADAVARGLSELGADESASARIKLLNLHGIVLRRAGRLLESQAALEQALALARVSRGGLDAADLPAVLNNLALVLQERDQHLAASGLLQESAGLQSDPLIRARVLNNLGTSLEERGQAALAYEQRLAAARLCAAAQTEGTADLMLAVSLGANARNLARFRDAIVHLAQAEAIAAKVPHWRIEDVHRQYAALWLELGRVNHARQALEAAERAAGAAVETAGQIALARARFMVATGEDARALLEATEQTFRGAAEQRMLRRLLICQAQILPGAQAATQMRELLDSPAMQDNAGAAIPAHVRLAQALLKIDQAVPALRHAQRAADALDVALPLDMSCAEVWLTLARALQAAGDVPAAAAAAARGKRWLEQIAALHLDPQYRSGYLERNPVNCDLLVLAQRLTHS